MYLLILVLGIVLLPEARTLRCYQCTPGPNGTCTETITQCPSETNQCAAKRFVSYAGSSEVLNTTAKSCAVSVPCGQNSFNVGVYRDILKIKCCSTDLCNNQPAEITPDVPNGRKCFTCDGQTCDKTLNCLGNEDRCISTTEHSDGQQVTLKGCASKVVCSDTQSAWMTRATIGEIKCCQGDYCNSESSSFLRCYECTPGQTETCTDTKTQCPSEKNQCAVQRFVYRDNSQHYDRTGKSCILPDECGELSFNIGVYRTVTASKCCNTNLCNTQPAPEVTPPVPNGRKCFVCDGKTCKATLNCLGNEDHCFSATVHFPGYKTTLKGCFSKAMCLHLPISWMTHAIPGEVNCCQGDYCNSASSTSAGLMLLVAPLISLVLS